jgi:hypothetical protein
MVYKMAEYLYESGAAKTSARIDEQGLPITDIYPKGSNVFYGRLKNVVTAGTRVRLDSLPCREVTVIARKSNTGSIFIGGSDMSGTNFGVELEANESFTFTINNANLIYIDASVSGEGVSYVTI